MRFADPKNDLAFKKIFGSEKHKNILISFLNAVLDFKGKYEIVDVELVNPYQVPKIPELKETILDIKATNKNKDNFIVEMQKKDLGNFTKRSLYYTSKAYVEQLPKGNDYTKLKKVYFIGILNFDIFDNKNYISRHLIINQETNKQDLDDFEFTFIELPKFNKTLDELETILDKWIYFLKHTQDLEFIPEQFKTKEEFLEAFEIVTQQTWDKKEMEVYDYIALKEFDEINALKTAERKGLAKGLEEGIQKGKEEGLKEGEKKAKIEIAKISLKQGLDIKTISLITGLAENEIKEIKL